MRSPISWYGGKSYLVDFLLSKVPPHLTYVEPFGGGASLLFAKSPSKIEVYNDLDWLVVTFFRCVRDHAYQLRRAVFLTPYSRQEWQKCREWVKTAELEEIKYLCTESPIEAARRLFVLCRQSFSGAVVGSGWSYGVSKSAMYGWLRFIDSDLPQIVERLRGVQIECLDAIECIEKYDTPDTFFYLDPPYCQESRSEARYRLDFTEMQHNQLFAFLHSVEGMVLLSGYHCPHEEELSSWYCEEITLPNRAVGTTRTAERVGTGALGDKRSTEVIWWNESLNKKLIQLDWLRNWKEVKK